MVHTIVNIKKLEILQRAQKIGALHNSLKSYGEEGKIVNSIVGSRSLKFYGEQGKVVYFIVDAKKLEILRR